MILRGILIGYLSKLRLLVDRFRDASRTGRNFSSVDLVPRAAQVNFGQPSSLTLIKAYNCQDAGPRQLKPLAASPRAIPEGKVVFLVKYRALFPPLSTESAQLAVMDIHDRVSALTYFFL